MGFINPWGTKSCDVRGYVCTGRPKKKTFSATNRCSKGFFGGGRCVCMLSPTHAIYFKASHWPTPDHMISSQALLGPRTHRLSSWKKNVMFYTRFLTQGGT